jgi:hypothetical protein
LPDRVSTIRGNLLGVITEFLADEAMDCIETQKGLVELVVALSSYHEEGVPLFPKVLICDNLTSALGAIRGGEHIEIGVGPKDESTIRHALKKSAPLARGGWVIFIERSAASFRYGVFREPFSPIALDLRDAIADQVADAHLILVSQIADKVVELVGGRGHRLSIHLSAMRSDCPSPREALLRLVGVCCRDSGEHKEPLESFMRTALSGALQRGHGALVGVGKQGNLIPQELTSEGLSPAAPVDLLRAVRNDLAEQSPDTLARLMTYASLLEGMLSCDGIVLFNSCGEVVAYNVFVRPPQDNEAPPSTLIGGARRRAFAVLRSLVDSHQLVGAFFRSRDGMSEYYGD